jgi:hypothetical protein
MSKKSASKQCRAVATLGELVIYGMNDGSVICYNAEGEKQWHKTDA